ncbi:MAG: thiamine pyrophosphate-dependent enzyme, partial [Ilumatobacteraceae bacterium]
MGTARARHQSQTDLRLKAASYTVVAEAVDGLDVVACEAAAPRGAAAVRAVEDAVGRAALAVRGGEPCFLELQTYRFRAHSMYDPELYRTKDEVATWRERDPIDMFVARLQREGLLDEAALAEIEARVAAAVDAAIEFADAGTFEDVRDLTRHVYAEAPR